eukprot:104213-Hanusia_phi.AAC.1
MSRNPLDVVLLPGAGLEDGDVPAKGARFEPVEEDEETIAHGDLLREVPAGSDQTRNEEKTRERRAGEGREK